MFLQVSPWIESRWRLVRRVARKDELTLIVLALLVGVLAGVGVIVLRLMVDGVQRGAFGVFLERHPARAGDLAWWRPLAVLCIGGLLYGLGVSALRRWHPREAVDPIEANALHGGNISFRDSVLIALMTVASVGVGASVGLEAAVTQIGSGLSSSIGRNLGLGRSQMRTLVGCGAAAAIAAAFNAPLAGTFYALELVIGGYAITALAPVVVAAISGTLVSRGVFGVSPIFEAVDQPSLTSFDYMLFALEGLCAALLGVLVMRGVTWSEALFRRLLVPRWLRPVIGGLLLAVVSLAYPHVLGSGHRGIELAVNQRFDLIMLLGLVAAKGFASAVSVGCGFRGGLFSAALFLGSVFGGAYGLLIARFAPELGIDYVAYTLVGMGGVAAAIIGAPITMIMLVFETTVDYPVAIGAAIAVIVASVATKRWFGYSFSTWRFHQRGVDLTGAYDVSRLESLTVRDVLNRNILRVPATLDIDTICSLFLLRSEQVMFVENADGSYAGTIDAAEANAALLEQRVPRPTARDLVRGQTFFVTIDDGLNTALDVFDEAGTDVIAVVQGAQERKVVGSIDESSVLRRYFREAEELRREELGDVQLRPTSARRVVKAES
ncbi:MAG TPA: chloride channel protein [Candidatus Cybelea sp.]|nr:chloride channel protein [Candidatus Cybelea sp.]